MEYYKELTAFLRNNIKKEEIILVDWTIIDKPPFEDFNIILPNEEEKQIVYIECLLKDNLRNDYKLVRHSLIILLPGDKDTNCEIKFSGELLKPPLHPFILDDYIFGKYPDYHIYCKLLPDIYLKQNWRKLKDKFALRVLS